MGSRGDGGGLVLRPDRFRFSLRQPVPAPPEPSELLGELLSIGMLSPGTVQRKSFLWACVTA